MPPVPASSLFALLTVPAAAVPENADAAAALQTLEGEAAPPSDFSRLLEAEAQLAQAVSVQVAAKALPSKTQGFAPTVPTVLTQLPVAVEIAVEIPSEGESAVSTEMPETDNVAIAFAQAAQVSFGVARPLPVEADTDVKIETVENARVETENSDDAVAGNGGEESPLPTTLLTKPNTSQNQEATSHSPERDIDSEVPEKMTPTVLPQIKDTATQVSGEKNTDSEDSNSTESTPEFASKVDPALNATDYTLTTKPASFRETQDISTVTPRIDARAPRVKVETEKLEATPEKYTVQADSRPAKFTAKTEAENAIELPEALRELLTAASKIEETLPVRESTSKLPAEMLESDSDSGESAVVEQTVEQTIEQTVVQPLPAALPMEFLARTAQQPREAKDAANTVPQSADSPRGEITQSALPQGIAATVIRTSPQIASAGVKAQVSDEPVPVGESVSDEGVEFAPSASNTPRSEKFPAELAADLPEEVRVTSLDAPRAAREIEKPAREVESKTAIAPEIRAAAFDKKSGDGVRTEIAKTDAVLVSKVAEFTRKSSPEFFSFDARRGENSASVETAPFFDGGRPETIALRNSSSVSNAAPASRPDPVARQILEAIPNPLRVGTFEIRPEGHGVIRVRISARGEGENAVWRVQIQTNDPAARSLLSEHLNELRERMPAEHVKVEVGGVATEVRTEATQRESWNGGRERNGEQQRQARGEEHSRQSKQKPGSNFLEWLKAQE